MHLVDVTAASSGPRGSSRPASRTRRRRLRRADPRQGQVVLCFFGDGASKQGAFHETLNIASLWKLPVVFVMENNGYNVHTRTVQEDANAADGEPSPSRRRPTACPASPSTARDPVPSTRRSARPSPAPAPARGRRWSSRVYRLCAHGNIIAPPGVPLHFPEHEAIEKFGAPEEYEAALRGDPVPRFRGRLVTDGALTAEEADRIAGDVRQEMPRPSSSASPARSRTRVGARAHLRLRREPMAHELPYIAAIDEAIKLEMERDDTVLYFGQNMATTENEEFVTRSGTTACA